jgi:hypothetical protein
MGRERPITVAGIVQGVTRNQLGPFRAGLCNLSGYLSGIGGFFVEAKLGKNVEIQNIGSDRAP